MYRVFPALKQQTFANGEFVLPTKFNVYLGNNKKFLDELQKFINCCEGPRENSEIILTINKRIPKQHYELKITEQKIELLASSEIGFFYAIKTLKQILLSSSKKLTCVDIKDGPDLKVRGFMYDISRNKVPTVETVKYIIDIMSDLKMNHLELYVEGFSFEYKSFAQYLEDESYITLEEYQEIEKYANDNYIDFVPNQNGFGHMADWLAKDEFKDLAESPNGIYLWGTHRKPSTLNALDPRSLELIKKMYQDMLPYTKSKYFNMNFDEPFELGKDKTKDACAEKGLGNVYLDHVDKAYLEIKKYHKIPLIWGDVIINHDDVLKRLPPDMIFVDWGYEAEYPFNTNLTKLKNAKIKFMAAPATTSWCSLLGRTYDWVENIYNAVWNLFQLKGEGVLLTDWGDVGHMQHLTASLAPLVFTGLLSYRVKSGTFKDLKTYLNKYIFSDEKGLMADVVIDAGTYYKYEPHYTGNGSVTFYSMVWVLNSFKEEDPISYFKTKMKYNLLNLEQYTALMNFFDLKKQELKLCAVNEIFINEINHSIDILKMIAKVCLGHQESVELDRRLSLFDEAINSLDAIIKELSRLWLLRNKKSGLDKTINNLEKMRKFALMSKAYYQGGKNETQN